MWCGIFIQKLLLTSTMVRCPTSSQKVLKQKTSENHFPPENYADLFLEFKIYFQRKGLIKANWSKKFDRIYYYTLIDNK